MIEQQLRDGLRAAVTQEPPLGFDPDDLVTRTSRAAHRRRTTFAALAAAAVVAAGSIGAVAATNGFGPPTRVPVAGPPAATPAQVAAKRLGNSLVDALSDLGPTADQFQVVVADSDKHAVAGMVLVNDGGTQQAVGFAALTDEGCPGCNDMVALKVTRATGRLAGVPRNGIALFLSTATTAEQIEADLGPMFVDKDVCVCNGDPQDLLSDDQLHKVLTDKQLVLPSRALLAKEQNARELRDMLDAERKAREALKKKTEELEREQAELERELERMKARAKKLAGGK